MAVMSAREWREVYRVGQRHNEVALCDRIIELEAALRPFADAVYNDNGDVTISTSHIEIEHYMRAKRLLSQ